MGDKMGDETISDKDFAYASVIGLARLVNKLTVMLVEGGALKRETAIRDLQEYREQFKGAQASHQMTKAWVNWNEKIEYFHDRNTGPDHDTGCCNTSPGPW